MKLLQSPGRRFDACGKIYGPAARTLSPVGPFALST